MKCFANICRINLLCFFLLISCAGFGKQLSPFDFGFSEAKNGEERFFAVFRTHVEAIKLGAEVDYSGIEEVDLTIPLSAQSIPLSDNTDFKNAKFCVLNNKSDFHLFSMVAVPESIEIDKKELGRIRKSLLELKGRNVLLCISDGNLWVKNRSGYSYGATRNDIVVVKKGRMLNTPIMPYDNISSRPLCNYYPLIMKKKVIKNISFSRDPKSTYKTYFIKIEGQYNLKISNISITTPESPLYGDAAIKIANSAKVRFSDIKINGTYSSEKKFGYGIAMNNVYDACFLRLDAHGKWGVFGTNNVQKISLKDCDINRFDIHCYGRDVVCENTTFRDMYNQFSSLFGTLKFKKCSFINFIPFFAEYSYNAYTGFDFIIDRCKFVVSEKPNKNCILTVGFLDNIENERPELREKCWPNVYINGLAIEVPSGVKEVYLMKIVRPVTSNKPIGYATSFRLNNISIVGENYAKLMLANYKLPVDNKIRVTKKKPARSPMAIHDNISKQ